jgi:hypothetical protein
LGIGVKRKFLISRGGRPISYVGFREDSRDRLFHACAKRFEDEEERSLLNFFKPMNSRRTVGGRLTFDWYAESEWRILFFDGLIHSGFAVDPRNEGNAEAHAYLQSLRTVAEERLRYLVPLDVWFSMIIYPSIAVKNAAMGSHEIRSEIERIKSNTAHDDYRIEDGNRPIELLLDDCRNF